MSKLKIVSFTMVNNEAEIIESFVRYNYNFVDKMVIIDNGCTDNTMEIVRKLKEEGYNIETFDESLEVYNQFKLDNKYLNKIISKGDYDIILPLDADEFISGDENPRKILESLKLDRVYYVHWKWYVLTDNDELEEDFIPNRLKYRLKRDAWNYSDNSPVTKVIIPVKYYQKHNLTLTMGHHDVFGSRDIVTQNLNNLYIGHYRAISSLQIVSKTMSYVIRDIATMSNNNETAQRTNQLNLIENGKEIEQVAKEVSYGGYTGEIERKPLSLKYCSSESTIMKYSELARRPLSYLLMRTGQEMAIREYNLERKIKEKKGLKPIVVWLDGVKGHDALFPDPSNKITLLASLYNVRAYLTDHNEINFLKANYRLILNKENLKFIPYQYIVIPDTVDFYDTKTELIASGIDEDKIVSLREYKRKVGILKNIYAYVLFIPSFISRIHKYIERNGISSTISKLKSRLKK